MNSICLWIIWIIWVYSHCYMSMQFCGIYVMFIFETFKRPINWGGGGDCISSKKKKKLNFEKCNAISKCIL